MLDLALVNLFPQASLPLWLCILASAVVYAGLNLTKRSQRYIADVPIVGGRSHSAIKENRLRFVFEAKEMLQDGYSKVIIRFVSVLFETYDFWRNTDRLLYSTRTTCFMFPQNWGND
jgi:hypothetical protein